MVPHEIFYIFIFIILLLCEKSSYTQSKCSSNELYPLLFILFLFKCHLYFDRDDSIQVLLNRLCSPGPFIIFDDTVNEIVFLTIFF